MRFATISVYLSVLTLLIILGSCTPIVIDETGNASIGTIFINEVMAWNTGSAFDDNKATFPDWVEIYNGGNEPIDLSLHYLTDNLKKQKKWQFPSGTVIEPGAYLVFWCDGDNIDNHTNFKLGSEGEEVGIYNSVGMLVDYVEFDAMGRDVSYGRKPDGGDTWLYFDETTAGSANTTQGVTRQVFTPLPLVSLTAGFYNGPQVIRMNVEQATAQIRYTLDGSIPRHNSTLYSGPLTINKTTVLRVRAFANDYLPGETVTRTYLVDENPTLPVVSIVTDPKHFFDQESGIYVKGPNAELVEPYYGANFWEDWERPVNVEFFERDGIEHLNMATGVKVYGGDSVRNAQKSLALYARDKYGSTTINYKFFPHKNIDQFVRIVLRNSGQDWPLTLFRDGLVYKLVEGRMDIDGNDFKPAVLYINGEYYGIQNIREKLDRYYLAVNHGADPDQVDLLVHHSDDVLVSEGDRQEYDNLIAFMETHDLSVPENFQQLGTLMDINEYMNYMIVELYIANADWPAVNIKIWRKRESGARFRWILFDTDFGMGMWASYHRDMMEHATKTDGPVWPNPPWSTYVFRKMLENPGFKTDFIQRFAGHLATTFETQRMLQIVESLHDERLHEMTRTIERWKGSPSNLRGAEFSPFFPADIIEWEGIVDVMRTFATRRWDYMQQHLSAYFNLSGMVPLTFNVAPTDSGLISVNTVSLPSTGITGSWFAGVPVTLTAAPAPGYVFTGWTGLPGEQTVGADGSVSVTFSSAAAVTAVFVAATQ